MKRRNRQNNGKKPLPDINPHLKLLTTLLTEFFNFLEKRPKPTDEEVRSKFKAYESRWVSHCSSRQLNPRASLLFNHEVARAWRERYAKRKGMTRN